VPGGPGAHPVRVLEPAYEGSDFGASRRPFPRPGAVRGVGGAAFRLLSRRRAPGGRGAVFADSARGRGAGPPRGRSGPFESISSTSSSCTGSARCPPSPGTCGRSL
jgi:hypothetical protein